MKTLQMLELTEQESALNLGGGFAYDAGRVLRFMLIAGGGSGPNIAMATADWVSNSAVADM